MLIGIETKQNKSGHLKSCSSLDTLDVSFEHLSIVIKITDMPSVASAKADGDHESYLGTTMICENNSIITTNKLTSVKATKSDGNNIENISSLVKTVIGAGVGFTTVVTLLSLKNRHSRLLS